MKTFAAVCLLLVLISAAAPGQDFWMPVNNGLGADSSVRAIVTAKNGSLFAGMADGILRSTDHGALWEPLVPEGTITLQSLAVDTFGNVYGGTDHGVFLSTDNGTSWTPINDNFPDSLVTTILLADSNIVYAGADVGALHRSTDMGGHWTPVGGGIAANDPNVMTRVGRKTLILGMDGGGIFVSHDNGNSWVGSNGGLTSLFISALATTASGAIFLGADGAYRSYNTGATWTPINVGLASPFVTSLLPRPSGEIYAGTSDAGVFRTVDNGDHWTTVNAGLGNFQVFALAADSGGYLYAGTLGGVYRSVAPVTAVSADAPEIPSSVALLQNYPNPFNPSTTIAYSIPRRSQVTLKLFNMLGQEVAILLNEVEDPGYRSVRFDGTGLTSGAYFYRLQAGSYSGTKMLMMVK